MTLKDKRNMRKIVGYNCEMPIEKVTYNAEVKNVKCRRKSCFHNVDS